MRRTVAALACLSTEQRVRTLRHIGRLLRVACGAIYFCNSRRVGKFFDRRMAACAIENCVRPRGVLGFIHVDAAARFRFQICLTVARQAISVRVWRRLILSVGFLSGNQDKQNFQYSSDCNRVQPAPELPGSIAHGVAVPSLPGLTSGPNRPGFLDSALPSPAWCGTCRSRWVWSCRPRSYGFHHGSGNIRGSPCGRYYSDRCPK